MSQRSITCVAAMAGAALLAGCETVMEDATGSRTEPVPIVYHEQGNDSAFRYPTVELINSQGQLEARASTTLADLDIDFERYSLLVLALGQRSTGGWSATITGVQRRGAELYVQGIAYYPPDEDMLSQVLTYPIAASTINDLRNRTIYSGGGSQAIRESFWSRTGAP